jgi:quinol monooxygenase YgiN
MGTTITPNATTLVNILTVEPDKQATLVDLLRENSENVVSKLDGWISTSFIVAKDRQRVVIYSQWRDPAAIAEKAAQFFGLLSQSR